jgi:hypothetical protein
MLEMHLCQVNPCLWHLKMRRICMIIATDSEPLSGSFYIKYYPKLGYYYGSGDVPKLIARLEYWFQKSKSRNGFYKFLEPCSQRLYKKGDSWTEELGISRKLFNKAFDLIGVRYKSKSQYEDACKQGDAFKGKLYASYLNHKTHKMHYIRNHAFADDFLKSIFKCKVAPTKPKKTPKSEEKGRGENDDTGRHYDEQNGQHPGGTIGGNNDQSFSQRSTLTSEDEKTTQTDQPKDEPKLEEEMKKIWQEEVGNCSHRTISPSSANRMRETLATHFESSLEKWREYCSKIASSKFLMGEMPKTNFKAFLEWAVKPEAIERIEGNGFTLGDRKKPIAEVDYATLCEKNIRNQPDEESRFFHAFIREKHGDLAYYNWFKSIKLEQESQQQIKILVPSAFYQQRIETYYSVFLKDAACLAFKRQCSYQIVVENQYHQQAA